MEGAEGEWPIDWGDDEGVARQLCAQGGMGVSSGPQGGMGDLIRKSGIVTFLTDLLFIGGEDASAPAAHPCDAFALTGDYAWIDPNAPIVESQIRDHLEGRRSIQVIRDSGLGMRDLKNQGITIDFLLQNGYGLAPLSLLNPRWTDLVEMGLTLRHLGRKWAFPPALVVKELNITGPVIHTAFRVPSIVEWALLGYGAEGLGALKLTADVMACSMGLNGDNIAAFGLTLDDWRGPHLKLTREVINNMGGMTSEQVHRCGWNAQDWAEFMGSTGEASRIWSPLPRAKGLVF